MAVKQTEVERIKAEISKMDRLGFANSDKYNGLKNQLAGLERAKQLELGNNRAANETYKIGNTTYKGDAARLAREKYEPKLFERNVDRALEDQDLARIRSAREADLARGKEYYDKTLGSDAFIKSTKGSSLYKDLAVDESLTPEMQQILKLRQDRLGGLTAEENQAAREEAYSGVNKNSQLASRALRAQLNKSGLAGGVNYAAQTELAKDQAAKSVDLERKLLLDNINIKNQALNDYETTYGSQRKDLYERSLRNDETLKNVLATRTGTDLGFAQLGAAERAQVGNQRIGEKVAENAANSSTGGKKHICGELRRRGLMRTDEYNEMSVLSVWAIFQYGYGSVWYFKNAKALINQMNLSGVDWKDVKLTLIDPALKSLRCGDWHEAGQHYARVLSAYSLAFSGNEKHFKDFDLRGFNNGLFRTFPGWIQILFMKEFWKTVVKMARVATKIYFKRTKEAFSG